MVPGDPIYALTLFQCFLRSYVRELGIYALWRFSVFCPVNLADPGIGIGLLSTLFYALSTAFLRLSYAYLWPLLRGDSGDLRSSRWFLWPFAGSVARSRFNGSLCCGRSADAFWNLRSFTLAGLQGFDYEHETIRRYMFARPKHNYASLRPFCLEWDFYAPFGKGQKKDILSTFQVDPEPLNPKP